MHLFFFGTLDDLFENRFADQQPSSFDERISTIEQKKWISDMFDDEVLKNVSALTTSADSNVKEMPEIASLEDAKVKQRIGNCWYRANKQINHRSM